MSAASVPAASRPIAAALLGLALLLAGCGAEHARPPPNTYVVKAGDTLYAIAWRHRLDYREVARWNGIGGDFVIRVGQVLTLAPPASVRAAARGQVRRGAAAARAPATSASGRTGATTRRGSAATGSSDRAGEGPAAGGTAAAATGGPATLPATVRWRWPTDGRFAGTVHQPGGGVGLRIDGTEGQEIRAAGDGRVVYTGAGLRAYGQLVIVRHDEWYLSAYGHNREVHVREGQEVRAGELIASMGRGPGDRPMLYFEIRLNGRPVDPHRLLPSR